MNPTISFTVLVTMNFNGVGDFFISLIEEIGTIEGLLVGIIVFLFYSQQNRISALYKRNIKDKQKEIDRIAKENREYREKFLRMIDEKRKHKS